MGDLKIILIYDTDYLNLIKKLIFELSINLGHTYIFYLMGVYTYTDIDIWVKFFSSEPVGLYTQGWWCYVILFVWCRLAMCKLDWFTLLRHLLDSGKVSPFVFHG